MNALQPDLDSRRARLAGALPIASDEILLVGAGDPIPLPENTDQTYPFIAHADYYYLTGLECAGGVVAYDPRDGAASGWHSFVPAVSEGERVWEGKTQPPGESIERLDAWLGARKGRTVVQFGQRVRDLPQNPHRAAELRQHFLHARRPKDAAEISLMRSAVAATVEGYAALRQALRPGVTERRLQIELEASFFRAGASKTGFGTIVGAGSNAAVLHFAPSERIVREGDFVLVDSGAEVARYTADVTRTYVCGTPSSFQRDLYQTVLGAQQRAIARCHAGTEWKDIHLGCAIDMVGGLVGMGLMRGNPETLVEREAHTLFFPHGIGHLVGLGVRDAGGVFPGRTKDPRPCLRTLRMDLPLAPHYVVTVEPGLYFIPAILDDRERRDRYRDCVDWSRVDAHRDSGGVRIEDDVLVTEGEPEVLTAAIPKTLD